MKTIKNVEGFTLIEMLVVINLSFLIVGAIVSFYMLTDKYIIGLTKRYEEKQTTYDFYYKLDEMLNKSDDYFFVSNETNSALICENDTVLFTENSITSRRLSAINDILTSKLRINLTSGDSIIVINGRIEDNLMYASTGEISSDSIRSIQLSIKKKNTLDYEIRKEPVPNKLFQNI